MKYLSAGGVGGCQFGDERLLWSGWTVLSDDALVMADDSTAGGLLFGLFMSFRFQHRLQRMLLMEKIWLVEK